MACSPVDLPWDHQHRIIDRFGNIHTVLSRGSPVRNDSGKVIVWVGVNLDITERKRTEVELKEAKEAREEALNVKDQFPANISHELGKGWIRLVEETDRIPAIPYTKFGFRFKINGHQTAARSKYSANIYSLR